MKNREKENKSQEHKMEWKSFLFICAVAFPILTIAAVSGYGFIVWMLQMFVFGPPGAQ